MLETPVLLLGSAVDLKVDAIGICVVRLRIRVAKAVGGHRHLPGARAILRGHLTGVAGAKHLHLASKERACELVLPLEGVLPRKARSDGIIRDHIAQGEAEEILVRGSPIGRREARHKALAGNRFHATDVPDAKKRVRQQDGVSVAHGYLPLTAVAQRAQEVQSLLVVRGGVGGERDVPARNGVVQCGIAGTRVGAVRAPGVGVQGLQAGKLLARVGNVGVMVGLRVVDVNGAPRKVGTQRNLRKGKNRQDASDPCGTADLRNEPRRRGKARGARKPPRRPHHRRSDEDAHAGIEPRGRTKAAPDGLQRREHDARKDHERHRAQAPLRARGNGLARKETHIARHGQHAAVELRDCVGLVIERRHQPAQEVGRRGREEASGGLAQRACSQNALNDAKKARLLNAARLQHGKHRGNEGPRTEQKGDQHGPRKAYRKAPKQNARSRRILAPGAPPLKDGP